MKSAARADSGYGLITDRQNTILEILIDKPGTSVAELSRLLAVTDATIRNDLKHL